VTPLAWDSDFFGVSIARADVEGPELDSVLEQARSDGIELVYLTAPAMRVDAVTAAVRRGGRLVDIRTQLEAGELTPALDARARIATVADRDGVERVAVALSSWSRFANDPRIPVERVREMYRIWARQCLEEGVVAVPNGPVSGLVGVLPGAEAHVVLVFVDAASARRGLGRALLDSALAAAGATAAHVSTQAGNVPALRLFEGAGFRVRSVEAVLHLWLDEVA
jgi:ribosomal protein S18 acetylase RimI-like enzyme